MDKPNNHKSFRLQPGSALERYLKASTANSETAKLHELAAAYEAVMKSRQPQPLSDPESS